MRAASRGGLFLLLALTGCEPDVELLGRVLESDGGVPPSTRVELRCSGGPQSAVPQATQTDALGRFALRGRGCLPTACVLLAGEGLGRGETQVMEWCKKTAPSCGAGTCNGAQVLLKLP